MPLARPLQYHEHWAATATPLPPRGFRLSYDTNIPRQAGLSGSSAIVTAALSCLEAYYGDAFALPRALRPALVLAAESALGITAGLQDRVVQSYEGVVYMVRPLRIGRLGRRHAHSLPRAAAAPIGGPVRCARADVACGGLEGL